MTPRRRRGTHLDVYNRETPDAVPVHVPVPGQLDLLDAAFDVPLGTEPDVTLTIRARRPADPAPPPETV